MKRIIFFALIVFPAFARAAELQRFVFERAEMAVPFRITLYAPDGTAARAAADSAFERVEVLNSILSDYDSDSELSGLSQTSGQGRAIPVSTDLWRVLEASQKLAARTDGAFDISVGPLVNLWRRARRKHELPDVALLAHLRNRVGYKNIRLDPTSHSVELLIPEMRLDLGAIAKGYAADEALAVLRARGFPRALAAASGDMAAGDPPPDQEGWRIEVGSLDVPGAPQPEIVWVKNCGIATSGDLFQRVEIDGVRYSHIVNPRTGLGLTDHALVTVVARDGITADGLATAVSVLGPEAGVRLVNETSNAAAHIMRKPAEKLEIIVSERWATIPKAR